MIYPCICGRYEESDNIYLNCNNQDLNDTQIDFILNVFGNNGPNVKYAPIGALGLAENQLTRVPEKIRFYNKLNDINLSSNNITSISTGVFNFYRTLSHLNIGRNPLLKIEPDAFVGKL